MEALLRKTPVAKFEQRRIQPNGRRSTIVPLIKIVPGRFETTTKVVPSGLHLYESVPATTNYEARLQDRGVSFPTCLVKTFYSVFSWVLRRATSSIPFFYDTGKDEKSPSNHGCSRGGPGAPGASCKDGGASGRVPSSVSIKPSIVILLRRRGISTPGEIPRCSFEIPPRRWARNIRVMLSMLVAMRLSILNELFAAHIGEDRDARLLISCAIRRPSYCIQ